MVQTHKLADLTTHAAREATKTATGSRTLSQRMRFASVPTGGTPEGPIGLCGPMWPLPTLTRDRTAIVEPAQSQVRSCVNGEAPWPLFLHGDVGSGKTCAALAVCDWCGAGAYSTLADLHRATYDDDWRSRTMGPDWTVAYMWVKWRTANLAVLDEVAERGSTDGLYDTLKRAIDNRLGYDQPLIVISNVEPSALVDVYDERIASRLLGGTMVRMTGDRRIGR